MSNRTKFVELISTELKLTRKEADNFLTTFTDVLRKHLIAEQEAVLPGFGRVYLKERSARKGHNPKTGASIDIPAKTIAAFKAFPSALVVETPAPEPAPAAPAA